MSILLVSGCLACEPPEQASDPDAGAAGVPDTGDASDAAAYDGGDAMVEVDAGGSVDDGGDAGESPDAGANRPPCRDDVLGDDESDVDCGGASCERCEPGRACRAHTDCLVGSCVNGRCEDDAPACIAAGNCAPPTTCVEPSLGHGYCRDACDAAGSCPAGFACVASLGEVNGCVPAPNLASRWSIQALAFERDPQLLCPPSSESHGGARGVQVSVQVGDRRFSSSAEFPSGGDRVFVDFSTSPVPWHELGDVRITPILTIGGIECFADALDRFDLRPRIAGLPHDFRWERTSTDGHTDFVTQVEAYLVPVR